MLDELFSHQAELNKRVGFDAEALRRQFDPQTAGQWLNNYIAAMSNELEELRDCTFWKHWCAEARQGKRFMLHDLQNARVEVIDLLFFWISMAQCLGLDAHDIVDLYQQKLRVNHQRQDTGYSMKSKTDADNKAIDLSTRAAPFSREPQASASPPHASRPVPRKKAESSKNATSKLPRPRRQTTARSPSRAAASPRRR